MNRKGTLAIVLLSATILGAGCMPYSTGPTEVGVRTVKWSLFGKKGVQPKVYSPGSTYFFVPLINDWNTFDTRLQNLEMTASEMQGDRPGNDELRFKTVDGNDIGLDVIISYRIDPDKAPTILQEVASDDIELKDNIVRTVARSKPRDIFGELETEDFYIADQRSSKAEETLKVLNDILNPYGVIVERVGTRDYRFNEAYQQAIEQKKVADQRTEKLKSETRAAEEEYLMRVEEAKGDIAKVKAEADGEYQRAVIEADAYFEQQKQIAEAIQAEAKAEAEALRKMNEALAGPGGPAMVKLKIAEALTGKRIVQLPFGAGGLDVRSTDINALLELYGLRSLAGSAKPSAKPESGKPAPAQDAPKPEPPAPARPPTPKTNQR